MNNNIEICYRWIIAGVFILQGAWFIASWDFAYHGGAEAALIWVGANALISEQAIIFISLVLTVLYFLAYIGLFFYQSWARLLLVLISLLGGFGIVLYGLSVMSGYEAVIGYFLTLGEGMIIAMAYFSSLSQRFR